MKKTYISPVCDVYAAYTRQMMVTSLQDQEADPNGEVLTGEDFGWDDETTKW